MTDPAKSGLIMIFMKNPQTPFLIFVQSFFQTMTGSVEELRVSSDSLESDLGDRDSLESGACSEDSLQIIGDSLGSRV